MPESVAPQRAWTASPAPADMPAWMNWLIPLSIAAVPGALGFALYWLANTYIHKCGLMGFNIRR